MRQGFGRIFDQALLSAWQDELNAPHNSSLKHSSRGVRRLSGGRASHSLNPTRVGRDRPIIHQEKAQCDENRPAQLTRHRLIVGG